MFEKTEQEIMQRWQTDEMTVSITCVAFNHEKYINTTLDSFLMQETTFPFEIIINDDVSTDRTVEILKEYETKYPNIVKPVYQSENQYSLGVNTMAILFPFVTGKYVAFCDGDDYWTDPEKLQIQVDALEQHPEIDLCFHSTYKEIDGERTAILAKRADKTTIFPAKYSILGKGDFAETASLMFTNSLISSLPDWFKTTTPGDYVSEIMGAQRGGSLYIDRTMSVYRSGLEGGWTEAELNKSTEERRESVESFVKQLEFLDNYLDQRFHKEFTHVIQETRFDFISMVINEIAVKKDMYEQYKSDFSPVEHLKWHLLYKHQGLIQFLKSIKKKLPIAT